MGYRAHIITQHRQYGAETFCDWEKFTDEFIPAVQDAGFDVHESDSQDYFEMSKEDLQKYVDTIPDNDEESVYTDYTNKELKEELQESINETKDNYVAWDWF